MTRHSKGPFCTCEDCALKTAIEHGVADAKCGRDWVCQCGSCKRARARTDAGIDVNFARLEFFEKRRATVLAIVDRTG